MTQAYCPNCKTYPEYLLSYPILGIEDMTAILVKEEQGVLLKNDGTPTGQYADGTAGVSRSLMEAAEEDEEPLCKECYGFIDWEH